MIKILLAQMPCTEGDVFANLAAMEAAWATADRSADLILFPELQLTGFAEAEHTLDRALSLQADALLRLQQLSCKYNQAAVVGFLEHDQGKVFNTSALITPEDGIRCCYRKNHLWDTERYLLDGGDAFVCTEWRGVKLGLITCFDIEFPESARCAAALGCEVLLVCDGNMDPYMPVHLLAARARAVENHMFVCLTNRCGDGMGLHFSGRSLAVAPDGRVLAEAGEAPQTMAVTIDTEAIAAARVEYDYLKQRRVHFNGHSYTDGATTFWRLT